MFVILSPKTLKRSSNNSAENGREVKGGWGGFPESEKKIEFLVEIGNLCLPLSTRWRWWCCALSLPFCRVSFHQCQVQAHPSWAQLYTNFSTPLLNFTWEPQIFLKLYTSFNKTPNSNTLILPYFYMSPKYFTLCWLMLSDNHPPQIYTNVLKSMVASGMKN